MSAKPAIILSAVIVVFFAYTFFVLIGKDGVVAPDGNTPPVTENKIIKLLVYFNNNKMDPEFSCNKVFSVTREVPETLSVARAALDELLKGPTEGELTEGFMTSIPEGVKIQSLKAEDRVIHADFNEALEYRVGGSCRVSAIRAQITETLKQFPNVDEAVISINGRTEDILQP